MCAKDWAKLGEQIAKLGEQFSLFVWMRSASKFWSLLNPLNPLGIFLLPVNGAVLLQHWQVCLFHPWQRSSSCWGKQGEKTSHLIIHHVPILSIVFAIHGWEGGSAQRVPKAHFKKLPFLGSQHLGLSSPCVYLVTFVISEHVHVCSSFPSLWCSGQQAYFLFVIVWQHLSFNAV